MAKSKRGASEQVSKIVRSLVVGMLGPVALLSAAPGLAQATSSSGFRSEYRLTDEEKERILTAAEAKSKPPPSRSEGIDLTERPTIGGEIGFGIGTDGSRSAFGSAFYPFGGHSGAMISFDFDRFGQLPQPLVVGNPNR